MRNIRGGNAAELRRSSKVTQIRSKIQLRVFASRLKLSRTGKRTYYRLCNVFALNVFKPAYKHTNYDFVNR